MVDQQVLGGAYQHDELDAFGRVIERTIDAASESFTYQGTSEALVQSVVGETATTFAQGPSGPIGYAKGEDPPHLYIKDLHSDVVAETPASGGGVDIRGASWYSPWGERESLDGALGLLGFQGQPHTQLPGGPELVDMTTRYYQAGLGRFSTGDVLFGEVSDPMSLNRFAYAGGSPVTNWDPLGLCHDGAGQKDSHCDVDGDGDPDWGTVPGPDEDEGGVASDPRTEAFDMSVSHRLDIVETFFSEFNGCGGCGAHGLGYGEALYDFVLWELLSERLLYSQWWRTVNGLLMRDISRAMAILRGDASPQAVRPTVRAWLSYARAATEPLRDPQEAFWRAHQLSLHAAEERTLDLYHGEGEGEQAFIRAVFVNVDNAAYTNHSSTQPRLGALTNIAYPGSYPVSRFDAYRVDAGTLAYWVTWYQATGADMPAGLGMGGSFEWSGF